MGHATPATRALDRAGVAYQLHEYAYEAGQEKIGLHAAEAIGADPARVLKTLMVEVDGRPACAVIPSDASLSMKKVAAAFGGKSAVMMVPAKAERLTGFHTGGISPFGQKRASPLAFEAGALDCARIILNGGKRGLMVELSPDDALAAARAEARPLIADQ
ncbi:Cys-tRNA(Pro) deacylase [Thioclava atlantica]|uniref:Cys-tRNA(Pro)/Cys-tRNA(Cys) deacylase n=1 Tax=Thioclava atlantica TaxID=1317124 RepID=A0A085TTT1_9RHOB|nr:Cys-tRNA(Pro) deacylase [Thioclava atlantica]KFE34128.1 transcriptional regulator [Thioclava atlantica]